MLTPLSILSEVSLAESLTDEDIDKLIADHWRELKGLLKEKKRRHETVPDPHTEPLDSGHRNGWAEG